MKNLMTLMAALALAAASGAQAPEPKPQPLLRATTLDTKWLKEHGQYPEQ